MSDVDALREHFEEKLNEFSERFPEEGHRLAGQLMLYGGTVADREPRPYATLWDMLYTQIMHRVTQHHANGDTAMIPEMFIDFLFAPNTAGEISAEIIMGRLQVG